MKHSTRFTLCAADPVQLDVFYVSLDSGDVRLSSHQRRASPPAASPPLRTVPHAQPMRLEGAYTYLLSDIPSSPTLLNPCIITSPSTTRGRYTTSWQRRRERPYRSSWSCWVSAPKCGVDVIACGPATGSNDEHLWADDRLGGNVDAYVWSNGRRLREALRLPENENQIGDLCGMITAIRMQPRMHRRTFEQSNIPLTHFRRSGSRQIIPRLPVRAERFQREHVADHRRRLLHTELVSSCHLLYEMRWE